MISDNVQKILKKQHYEIVGNHSAVQICRWTKKSLRGEGVCYKEKFYGIKSHLCCQMTPSLFCPNKCVHCWRAIEFTSGEKIPEKINSAKEIIDGCIEAQRKLLKGFKIDPKSRKKQLSKADPKKYSESQEPMQFAISLSGEPTMYENIGELIEELSQRGKTSFLVTNGLYPKKILELKEKNQLPTQLYVSVNSTNKKDYEKFHHSLKKNAWEKLNETLDIMSTLKGKTRTVFRINLIRNLNMEDVKGFTELIKKAKPQFIEVKGYMAVGFARKRLGYERMPTHEEIRKFSEKLVKELNSKDYKILDEHEFSRVLVIGKYKKGLKIVGV